MANNERRRLTILKDILKTEVKLEEDETKGNVQILGNALDIFLQEMKRADPLFRQLHNRIFYTGSYYGGLRVKKATEFDLNLILVFPFPFRPSDFEISTNCSPPSFAKFRLTARLEEVRGRNADRWQEIRNVMNFFEDDYLIPQNIRRWFQGIVDRALQNLPGIPSVSRIQQSSNGPAMTLRITTNRRVQLDVDLVPVIEFKYPNWPNNARQHFSQIIPNEAKYWFLVPKPAPTPLAGRRENIVQVWRLHFPGIEHQLLHNRGCAKPVIKLMKLLRDRQNWNVLASYYLKTVVMWSIINDRLDWKECNMATLFTAMLKKLEQYVSERHLPYLFYPSFNLLYKLKEKPVLAANIDGALSRVIRDIERDPEKYYALMRN